MRCTRGNVTDRRRTVSVGDGRVRGVRSDGSIHYCPDFSTVAVGSSATTRHPVGVGDDVETVGLPSLEPGLDVRRLGEAHVVERLHGQT